VACPLPQDEEMVSPKMVIFTRFSSSRLAQSRDAGGWTQAHGSRGQSCLAVKMQSGPSRWLCEVISVGPKHARS